MQQIYEVELLQKASLNELLDQWDPKHSEVDEKFNHYMKNDGFENIVGDECMQNLNMEN